jgi:hypothetical protein
MAIGQVGELMSAFGSEADIGTEPLNVRYVPKADILHCNRKSRLDHLAGAGNQQRGLFDGALNISVIFWSED